MTLQTSCMGFHSCQMDENLNRGLIWFQPFCPLVSFRILGKYQSAGRHLGLVLGKTQIVTLLFRSLVEWVNYKIKGCWINQSADLCMFATRFTNPFTPFGISLTSALKTGIVFAR